ncbi:unnamed protein product [Bursaphelenchus xylophilus]|uniref:(pine wood nematode) hypothetical protein n=1 Tax=Bursaphelenchus xylophilus TaxID=6326 RepID=A0A1I7SVI2_BURXY|nr:unnamed protein product [Bursaphelenchus xylophilus]CAG9101492.1 unnamed protein product [Bursaphelenchus xylophilus]
MINVVTRGSARPTQKQTELPKKLNKTCPCPEPCRPLASTRERSSHATMAETKLQIEMSRRSSTMRLG